MNKLSKRLSTIASIVDKKFICDIGCDHGYLAEYLLENKIVNFVYVSDISSESLKKAQNLLNNRFANFQAICTDGLKGYEGIDNIEQCIISGMGGDEIVNIIKNSPITINSFILSPQHNIIETKKFMLSIGYDIVFDIIIKDKNKFYTIFKCEKSNNLSNYSEYELLIGKDNLTNCNSDIREYVDLELNKLNNLLNKVNESKKIEIIEKCELLNKARKELEIYE